ncbi:uncharacterized protein K441DRAFT_121979 [Cenococcum geophilum 1.58]|uniref:uncharacterized protein n=1 Tax=Cenococcum geophilum 1.58 TaxID=794803 RepID=UPI00358E7A4B|nr:hypothetical protein K441DRAFT_121979 [Cenococcum geophilum 1.58]
MPTCLYLPIYATCLYLPSVPTVCASYLCYCLCLPVCNLGERSARSKAPPDLINRLIVLIRIVLYGRSLAVYSNGGRLALATVDGRLVLATVDGCLVLATVDGRLVLATVDGRLVLATVVWLRRRSSGSGDCRLALATVDGRLVLATVLSWLPFWCLPR